MNMHTHAGRVPASAPPPPAGGLLDFPVPTTPEARKAICALRRAARDEIERLLAFLDRTEGDHDLEEDGDDEPWLAAPECHPSTFYIPALGGCPSGSQAVWAGGGREDFEADDCDEEDGADREDDDAERGMPL